MTRRYERLKALNISQATKPGLLADGGGLYLRIGPSGSKSWIFRYMLDGRARDMGLGPLHTVSLSRARQLATEYRLLKQDGHDPIESRKGERKRIRLQSFMAITFAECAEEYISSHQAGWRNVKHVGQWRSTIATYVVPVFGELPVQQVDTELVLKCLKPIWQSKPETASRLRGRIENILDWAKVKGYREGENPAVWKGHLDKLLPPRSKVRAVKHHSALPYANLPAFMAQLDGMEGVAAQALHFAILTATRTGEIIGAVWDEIHDDTWVIPADRMKAGQEHRVPLSKQATGILTALPRVSDFIFPGQSYRKGLSNMAMLTLLKRMDRNDLTVHGFRSTFRDWAAERTNTPREVAEAALAHQVGSKVEAAYRRGDLFEKRARPHAKVE